jgi:DNA-binding winged helix-turn-helix (wHTH) protein
MCRGTRPKRVPGPCGEPDVDVALRRPTTCERATRDVPSVSGGRCGPEGLAAGESGQPEWRIVMASAQCAEPVALATGAAQGAGFEAARRLGGTHVTALLGARDSRGDQAVREGSHADCTFWLDTVNEDLWCAGVPIDLTPKAFAVLRYLVEHPGRLVTQQELLDALWPDVHVQPEIVKTYIRDIRRILGDRPKGARFIETRPRRGYTFVAAVTNENGPGPAVARVNGTRDSAPQGTETPCHPEAGDETPGGPGPGHHGGVVRRRVRHPGYLVVSRDRGVRSALDPGPAGRWPRPAALHEDGLERGPQATRRETVDARTGIRRLSRREVTQRLNGLETRS